MPKAKQTREFFTRGATKYLALAFVLFFLSVQSLTLAHAHSGDLQKHVDCTLCLKIGFGHDILNLSAYRPCCVPIKICVLEVQCYAFI